MPANYRKSGFNPSFILQSAEDDRRSSVEPQAAFDSMQRFEPPSSI
ncbi:hypothetical protein QUA54_20470 [Microcoleus sp. MOSTC5]